MHRKYSFFLCWRAWEVVGGVDTIVKIDYNILTKTAEKIAQTYPPWRKIKCKLSEIAA